MIALSVLSRRRMNGAVSFLSRREAAGSCSAWIGTWKVRLNSAWVPSQPALRNSMIDQRSPTWFSTGVPVRAIRLAALSARAAWACLVWGFLMFWASSRTRLDQSTCRNSSKSRCRSE